MPLPHRAHGRPGTAVFPPDWDTDHAQIIDGTHKAAVTVGPRSTVATWNETDQQMETGTSTPVYTGPATIAPASLGGAAADIDAADDQVNQTKYAVTLLHDAHGITADHVVVVTACSDLDLQHRTLTIDGLELGSRRFARHLICTLI